MLRNYFKTAWRSLIRNKAYSLLNILGLATGIGVALLIGLWVYHQYSFDKFLPGYKQLYQVRRNFFGNGDTVNYGGTSLKLANTLRTQIPEIESVVESDGGSQHGLMVGDRKIYLRGNLVASEFLTTFRYPLMKGDPKNVLSNPFSIVLTQSTAKTLFGNEDPINKTVRFDNKNDLRVTGVLDEIPANSSLQFGYLVPFSYLEATDDFVKRARAAGFGWTNFTVYTKLKPGISYAQVEPKIRNLEKTETDNSMSMTTNIMLDPIENWHLYTEFEKGKAVGGFIEYVRLFTLIGILVLMIACINFVNLTTASSGKRAKEVGVRKVMGSGKRNLIFQFLTESVLLVFIGFILSLMLVLLALPAFKALSGDAIEIPFTNYIFWLVAVGCALGTGILAGSKPAFYLSSFEPVKVLKGKINIGKAATWPRKLLVVLQFSCSIALIISTYIIYQQVQYARDRPSGYDKKRLMITDMNQDLGSKYTAIKNELIQTGIVESVTTASNSVTTGGNHRDVDDWRGKRPGESVDMGVITISDDYFKTVGMKMKEGRSFGLPSDTLNVVFNEAAVKLLRLENPLDQTITWLDTKLRIIGIVKNALMQSPFSPADPTIFLYDPHPQNVIMYRVSPIMRTRDAISRLSAVFGKYNAAYPYTYTFADESYAAKFKLEVLIGKLSGLFSLLAIFISSLGLFGLAAYLTEQRTKEIGIRKVLGASALQAWLLLSGDFIILVLISSVIASLVAFYFMHGWLLQYDYRIMISPLVFVFAGLAAIAITIITVSFQTVKAAIINPAKSLKAE